MTHTLTTDRSKAAATVALWVGSIVRSEGEVPKRHVYSTVAATGLSYNSFGAACAALVDCGVIREENNLLIYNKDR